MKWIDSEYSEWVLSGFVMVGIGIQERLHTPTNVYRACSNDDPGPGVQLPKERSESKSFMDL